MSGHRKELCHEHCECDRDWHGGRRARLPERAVRELESASVTDADWSSATNERLKALREQADSGDEALQSLMLNFVMHNAQDGGQAKRLSTVIAGIKLGLVEEIMHEFPTTSMDDLVTAAKAAGYDVDILS